MKGILYEEPAKRLFDNYNDNVRTTNDVEGWHTHLANHACLKISSRGLNLYTLLEVLYDDAIKVDMYTRMLEEGHILRKERKTFRVKVAKLFSFWNDYSNSVISTEELLEKCAEIYTNFNASKFVKTVDDFRLLELETE
ncbi:hypothetical protein DAPPUDRAFT_105073 [Daphnia pulex]|uniref:Uncharacterized protein n=1 Tax=Daphnia pulex TaxID=6669 RepID=E9GPC0_DAPPU|nr:hypothetical protein DAPPUDRAFT_105073 [Daphnia pulex]|eukprot:EFX78707.1 hypothetical protein DAPPUDRAFT_105073 [Daphnia pulex]